ncbi:unnamed protein product, partial [Discosporangium mesarthrocarpum]
GGPSGGSGDVLNGTREGDTGGAGAPAPPTMQEAGGVGEGGEVVAGCFMMAKGPLKIREEADPFSADIGALETGSLVKVAEVSGLWVRVAYHGREDGWVLTANKRGPMLVPEPRADVAESAWEEQEAQAHHAAESATADADSATKPVSAEDLPIRTNNDGSEAGGEGETGILPGAVPEGLP